MTPLSGLRVVETGASIAMRYAGHLFAGLGAEVYQADARREHGTEDPAETAYELWMDEGKRSLSQAAGPFHLRLADRGAETKDGLQADLSVFFSWFGDTGPYAEWQGSDGLIQALSGAAYSFGEPDGAPTIAQGHAPSLITGATAVIAALAALIGRRQGDGPSRIDVNVLEAALCITENAAIGFAAGGPPSRRLGVNRFFPTYPATSYETADGWVGVTALTPSQWRGLCGMLGLADAAADPRFATADMRLAKADEIDELLAPAFLAKSADQWAAEGQAFRIPMTAMARPGDLPKVEHWQERNTFRPLPGRQDVLAPRLPFIISAGHRHPNDTGSAPPPSPTSGSPLAGLRVLDFSMGWSGPLATRHLGDLGADVIKVESTDYPDWWRGWETKTEGDPPPHEIRSAFNAVNRSKRGITLDLRREDGRALARELVRGSDIVIENFTTGVLEGFGLGAKAMQEIAPGLISVSMGAFGAAGPLKGYRAYGSTVEQASGLPFVNGRAEWKPCLQHVAYGDAIAGLYAAIAALACRFGRPEHGGAAVDLSQVECLFQIAAPAIIREQVTGSRVARTGSSRAGAAPCGCVRCAGEDEWLFLEIENDRSWQALCDAIGRPQWASDPSQARRSRESELLSAIEEWTRGRSAEAAADALQQAGVSAAPVARAHLLAGNKQLAATGFWTTGERRHVGRHLVAQPPYRLDGERPAIRRPAPLLGEHDEEVLGPLARTPAMREA